MNEVVRWFDASLFLKSQEGLFYFILIVVWSNVIGNIMMMIVNLKAKNLDVSVQTHYLIKISMALSHILSYGGVLTISRNCLSLI